MNQIEREAAAYAAYLEAWPRDRAEAYRLWLAYCEIHAQRPRDMVERMEHEQGLR